MIKNDVLSVTEFVQELKGVIQHHPSFKNVALIGELSNFKAHHSGHFYFSLKDDKSRINCVMFRSKAQLVRFKPKDGDRVVIHGAVEVFEASGTVQIYASRMNLDGLGDLYIQFEALKNEFIKKGYFDAEHKKEIPQYPQRIGVITGENSAAYHDISRTLKERWPFAEQVDLLAYVQGENAIESLVHQIHSAQTMALDVIILARGGGSIEDLWAFNETAVVEAIYESEIPIISGVGHESDVTLSDYVADYRAATPTAAAVHATPNRVELHEQIRTTMNHMYQAVKNKLLIQKHNYTNVMQTSYLSQPMLFFDRKQQTLDYYQNIITKQTHRFDDIKRQLNQYPLHYKERLNKQMNRHQNNLVLIEQNMTHSLANTQQKAIYTIQTQTQALLKTGERLQRKINQEHEQITLTQAFIYRRSERLFALKKQQFADIIKTISNNNPMEKLSAIFNKGFVQVHKEETIINSIQEVTMDDTLELTFNDGNVTTKVIGKEPKHE